jgi:hypothetical protein
MKIIQTQLTNLPVVTNLFIGIRRIDTLIQGKIGLEILYWNLAFIQVHIELLAYSVTSHRPSNIINPLTQQCNCISVQMSHVKPLQVRLECNFGVIASLLLSLAAILDDRIFSYHVVFTKELLELFAPRRIETFNDELGREDIGKFSSVAIASSRRLLFIVIKVRSLCVTNSVQTDEMNWQ